MTACSRLCEQSPCALSSARNSYTYFYGTFFYVPYFFIFPKRSPAGNRA